MERELKYFFPKNYSFDKDLLLDLGLKPMEEREDFLLSIYFDNEKRELIQNQYLLRLRISKDDFENIKLELTMKWPLQAENELCQNQPSSAFSKRGELNLSIKEDLGDLAFFDPSSFVLAQKITSYIKAEAPKHILPEKLKNILVKSDFTGLFSSEFERRSRVFFYRDSVIEEALDRGFLLVKGKEGLVKEEVLELEFELKKGKEKDLILLQDLLATKGLKALTKSKYQRLLDLEEGQKYEG